MSTLTMSTKGQLTVPRALREQLKLRAGCEVDARIDEEGRLILTPLLQEPDEFLARRPPRIARVASIEEMEEGIRKELCVVAFDTNVIVRLLLRDDAAQAKKAEQTFLRHARGDGIFLPLVALVETVWVLAYTYELDRKSIHNHLRSLARTRGVVIELADLFHDALEAYSRGTADFADHVILAATRRGGCRTLMTFDHRLGKERGMSTL